MNLGIDKIALFSNDFRINNLELLKYKAVGGEILINDLGNLEQNPSPIYSDMLGNSINAKQLYQNGKFCSIDIENRKGLIVTFNPSKHHHAFNLANVGSDNFKQSMFDVQNELSNVYGIEANIENMNLTRVDIAKQYSMNLPLIQYPKAYSLIKGSRTASLNYCDGHVQRNKSHEAVFYNKQAELLYNKVTAITPSNFLRAEARFKKGKKVEKTFNIKTLKELQLKSSDEINFMYNQYMRKVLTAYKNKGQYMLQFETQRKLFTSLKNKRFEDGKLKQNRGYFNNWLLINSIPKIFQMFGNSAELTEFLSSCGESRKSIFAFKNKLEMLKEQYLDLEKSLNKNKPYAEVIEIETPFTMLNEIRTKFLVA